jgi:DNA-binding IclR family transcriptional regulator
MTRTSERMAAIVAVLDAEPGLLTSELADRLGYNPERLAPLLWRMEDERLIVHEGRRWFAVPAG